MPTAKATKEATPQSLEEAMAEVQRLKAELEEANQKATQATQTVSNMKKAEEGWLVLTPNVQYDGVTCGVQFTDGAAFILKNRVYPRFQPERPPDNQLAVLPDAERAAIEKSLAIPSSERLVLTLTNDYGYRAEYYSVDQLDQLKDKMSTRARERAEVQAKLGDPRQQFEKLLEAKRLGV